MSFHRTLVDIHLVHTVPPSCVNRDDTGSPKTALYGGVRRARVSSQSWKRATRTAFATTLDTADLGVRTVRVVELVAKAIEDLRADAAEIAPVLAEKAISAAGVKVKKARKSEHVVSGYLVLISRRQAQALARLALEALDAAGGDSTTAAVDKRKAKQALDQGHSIDLALFGRMVADDKDLSVDAACQVAHAISVHEAETEFDYFTAVDDLKETQGQEDDEATDAGAGMIGTVEFCSSTLYRYATIDVDALYQNLADAAMTRRAVEAFLSAFVSSMPTGKANTFANHTRPEAILVSIRDDRPVSLVGAFEEPVLSGTAGGFAAAAIERLVVHAEQTAEMYGDAPLRSWAATTSAHAQTLGRLGEVVPVTELASALGEQVAARVPESA